MYIYIYVEVWVIIIKWNLKAVGPIDIYQIELRGCNSTDGGHCWAKVGLNSLVPMLIFFPFNP